MFKMKGHSLPGPNQKKSPLDLVESSSGNAASKGRLGRKKRKELKKNYDAEKLQAQRKVELNKQKEMAQSTLNIPNDPDRISAKDQVELGIAADKGDV